MAEKVVAASPAASGPAGSLFEGQVGAHYLLTMLAESEPRGLPGAKIQCVEFQRAGEGHPLDDVIIRGSTRAGAPTVLEVQVKRTISFAPTDSVFKDVVKQLGQAFEKLDLLNAYHQFAVATERTSFKITGPYQDILRWAREVSTKSIFFDRINRKNVGNDDMRNFIKTVRKHLADVDCPNDDETVWQILRRFQILTFDYDAPGSQSLELALERACRTLEPSERLRALGFWKALTETAIRTAASGGDLSRGRLISELTDRDGFRLLGSWKSQAPRESIAEAATLAAADLRQTIAGNTLARQSVLDAVRVAQDSGRYVEIRGAPGVGKSGILGMLAQQTLIEGRAVVLTPDRTVPGGWLALKTTLGVDLSPKEFLADLANDGGAVLFVDSLDFFDDSAKRATVVDLVRSASEVPNLQVIVTARTDFGKDEPNWLPPDILTKLGQAPPVVISELASEEVEELRTVVPSLVALLADNHPARSFVRNLFRLSRLVELQGERDKLRSEVDLLERWWATADGPVEGRRARARLLADITDAALDGKSTLQTSAQTDAVDALLVSETLRELTLDNLTFRHDVLREWGVAARLHDSPLRLNKLPLDKQAPASISRGVELAARFVLERSSDGERWLAFLDLTSPKDAHASWRRWSLLAILRSELAFVLLEKASSTLFGNDGALLKELIRTAIAAESRPMAETFSELGVDSKLIPTGIFSPSNASWSRLTQWLLLRQADIPLQVIPDVVELFQNFSVSLFFMDPFTPEIAEVLADWLDEVEDALEINPFDRRSEKQRFGNAFGYYELRKLAEDIRQAFVLMSGRVPERSQKYLQRLLRRERSGDAIRQLLKFRGTLAQAAPTELAEVTFAGLVEDPKDEDDLPFGTTRDKIFTHLDSDFLPSSPAQGPFLELLSSSQQHGLALIRRLVDHAVTVLSKEQPPGNDGVTLMFRSGPRHFPWMRTYYWSRNAQGLYAIESALMALEAWSHQRIENGEDPDDVITDILGPEGTPAAFVLVAVDILISHWPKTMKLAVPFLGSPQLLSEDKTRQIHDQISIGSNMSGEPTGKITLADLRNRPSRGVSLERLVGSFALNNDADHKQLNKQLNDASEELGPYESDDTFSEPRFMASYAINVMNPENWKPVEGGHVYVSPKDEQRHLADLNEGREHEAQDLKIDTAIQNSLEDTAKASSELVAAAITYAKKLDASDASGDDLGSLTNAVTSAAMMVARDGDEQIFSENEEWVRGILGKTLKETPSDYVREMRDGIRYNPIAIATLGLIHLWNRRKKEADLHVLLELAASDSAEAAHGMGAGLQTLRETDRRIIVAVLRCALSAQIRPTRKRDETEEKQEASRTKSRGRLAIVIEAERAWLCGKREEPDWPIFPAQAVHIQRGIRIGGRSLDEESKSTRGDSDNEFLSQSAALWVRQMTNSSKGDELTWLSKFIASYGGWTAKANGAGLDRNADITNHPGAWNSIFYRLLTRAAHSLSEDDMIAEINRAIDVPDRSFFDVASELVPAIDQLYFDGQQLDLNKALKFRTLVVDRLMDSAGWQRECDRSELSVEMRIGPAIGVMFFGYYGAIGGSRCYLLSNGIDHLYPFLPHLTRLIEAGPVPFTAQLTMDLLEVSPRAEHVDFFLSSAITWLKRQPSNTKLWVDFGLGSRLAKWLEIMSEIDSALVSRSHPIRTQVDDVLARLVQLGVADANRVERIFQ